MAFVGSADLDRSHEFYGGVLGLELVERTEFANLYDAGGTPLRVTHVAEPAGSGTPSSGGSCPTSPRR